MGIEMSVSIGAIATGAAPDDRNVTEQEMAPYVWTMLGLCNVESGTAREPVSGNVFRRDLAAAATV